MSTDQQSPSYDPRYDGIYQRGGVDATQEPQVQAIRHLPARTPSRSPQQSDPHDQSAAGHHTAVSATATPLSLPESSPSERQQDGRGPDTAESSMIREVEAPPEAPEVLSRARNPFDIWVWVVAAALTALGVYFLTAPIFGAEAYAEQMMSQRGTNPYTGPWWQHTSLASLPLILLGVGTAVTQLFVLSIRHTLRAR